ncbi:hypothetical protein BMS3Abin10_00549 [bacterium BMS3Abin10]|nr:hypothetical protein BMS3Abin10_00549 [bacterium BMS3Abin10]
MALRNLNKLYSEFLNLMDSNSLAPFFALGLYIELLAKDNKMGWLDILDGKYLSHFVAYNSLAPTCTNNYMPVVTVDVKRLCTSSHGSSKRLDFKLALLNLVSAINLNVLNVTIVQPIQIQFFDYKEARRELVKLLSQQGFNCEPEYLYSVSNHRCDVAVVSADNVHFYELGTLSEPWKIFSECWTRPSNFCIHIIPYSGEHFIINANEKAIAELKKISVVV